jgi:hypothetical protein
MPFGASLQSVALKVSLKSDCAMSPHGYNWTLVPFQSALSSSPHDAVADC